MAWPAAPLQSRERAAVRVRVAGEDGAWSERSRADDRRSRTARAFRLECAARRCRLAGGPASPTTGAPHSCAPTSRSAPGSSRARLYATAHGLYEAELNGSRVGDDALSPGWTVYRQRLRYYTYDVTDLLHPGPNAIGAWLGDGWYRGRLGWRGGFRNLFGDDLSFLGQLELTYADGRRETVATDAAWKAAPRPIVRTGIYDGEDYDARDEPDGWSSPGFDDDGWERWPCATATRATLVAPTARRSAAPRRSHRSRFSPRPRARASWTSARTSSAASASACSGRPAPRHPAHRRGAAGRRALHAPAPRGALHRSLHARRPRDGEKWEPRFTFHGFRYVEVDGWPGDLDAARRGGDLVARVYHTDLERTGWFDRSDRSSNRLHENVVWGMRGNFVDIPTDCPQRDERVGWTGDIQVFAPTASFLYDASGMLTGGSATSRSSSCRTARFPGTCP